MWGACFFEVLAAWLVKRVVAESVCVLAVTGVGSVGVSGVGSSPFVTSALTHPGVVAYADLL